jgi:hypothetical protein
MRDTRGTHGAFGMKWHELFCDRCLAKIERYLALMDEPDPFFATAAASGSGDLCDRCEPKLRAVIGTPPKSDCED